MESDILATQRIHAEALTNHGEAIARLEAKVDASAAELKRLADAYHSHAQILNEYSGARKALYFLFTIGVAIGGWFLGKGGHHS
jgi:hypothetical protein